MMMSSGVHLAVCEGEKMGSGLLAAARVRKKGGIGVGSAHGLVLPLFFFSFFLICYFSFFLKYFLVSNYFFEIRKEID